MPLAFGRGFELGRRAFCGVAACPSLSVVVGGVPLAPPKTNMGKGAETKGEHGSSVVGLAPRDGLALFRGYEKGYETGMVKGMEVGYEKGMSKGMEKGYEKGKSQGAEMGLEKGIEVGYEEGQAFDKGYFKGMDKGEEMGFKKGSESGYDRGYEKGLLAHGKGLAEALLQAGVSTYRDDPCRPRVSARGGSSPDVHRRVPPKSKRARSQWPRSPRPSSSEADLEAELEEKPSPKPRPRLSQLDPASYELHEEDNYEWWEETMRMQDEDVGIEYEDESRQRLLRGHNTDDTESTLEFGVNPEQRLEREE